MCERRNYLAGRSADAQPFVAPEVLQRASLASAAGELKRYASLFNSQINS